ncbi:MAG: L-tyrosine/L-tryptophan isonitrile synthase family protein [Myxococcota bacterium]|nr:isocyanide synthase family protein [Myxococcota bacterium]
MYTDFSAATVETHSTLFAAPKRSARAVALEILGLVLPHRRIAAESEPCELGLCEKCAGPHLSRVIASVELGEPVVFVLPAFPGKSPNPSKVLSARADMAERQSLAFLNELCRRVQAVYAPGARMVLCSDGRVFSDVVGIDESDITTYQRDLSALIADLGATALSTFNLDDVFTDCSFDAMRARLMASHGQPLEALQAAVREGGEPKRMYCGITRFLFEDGLRPDMTMSKTALQKDCRRRAYEVVQRSKAWDGLLATCFPDAVRLSIHPQVCGSRKLGIHLMETMDGWLTPWHGVAVEVDGSFVLRKRREVEEAGATLVFANGRPSHYVMQGAAS